ncbi:MAG TPA: hypothetical protein DHW80_06975 [Acinetobacter sp.]|nr:hypothetical protein [Acinetobacter sp.]
MIFIFIDHKTIRNEYWKNQKNALQNQKLLSLQQFILILADRKTGLLQVKYEFFDEILDILCNF